MGIEELKPLHKAMSASQDTSSQPLAFNHRLYKISGTTTPRGLLKKFEAFFQTAGFTQPWFLQKWVKCANLSLHGKCPPKLSYQVSHFISAQLQLTCTNQHHLTSMLTEPESALVSDSSPKTTPGPSMSPRLTNRPWI